MTTMTTSLDRPARFLAELTRVDRDMTAKAQRYLTIVGIYCVVMGLACVLRAERVSTPSFEVISNIAGGMPTWGWAHIVVGITALLAAARQMPNTATLALMGVAALALPWTIGFYIAYDTIPDSSPAGFIIFFAWAVLNLDQSRNALTAPMERLIPKLAHSEPLGGPRNKG